MNAVVFSILIMTGMSLLRIPVVFALIASAAIGGLYAGLKPAEMVAAFNGGLGNGAPVALAYATLGAFAVMLSRAGVTQKLTKKILKRFQGENSLSQIRVVTWSLYTALILMGFISGTIIPVHIAFIPIVVPPLLLVMNHLELDRRAVACAITFSITVMYMSTPIGFGAIYLNDILMANINSSAKDLGFEITRSMPPKAMFIPAMGMVLGLLLSIFVTYRKKRTYQDVSIEGQQADEEDVQLSGLQMGIIVFALISTLAMQLWTGSMVFGGMVGFAVMSMSKVVKWKKQDGVFTEGMRMMAMIGFIMIAANGFAGVMKATGEIASLVDSSVNLIGDSKNLAAIMMLVVGLFITMGIGSSFSTVPIIATIFVPICVNFGFSPLATVALIGTAGALGDAGSPVSDSTLGPTAGLNADGQHDHIWDTVVPTFIHFNIPLIVFGWLAAMVL
ncbi:MAG: sodium:proton antiporter [Deltaproteobacteria bacterium]|nr:MAG: sodium:proton antiporter [Deltaproteobacteria bacterium]PIE73648.1 MAG: sodium:proton antiporter [Deltaproteobacteria bacterium]